VNVPTLSSEVISGKTCSAAPMSSSLGRIQTQYQDNTSV
jgi:hypothetical protein